MIKFLDNQTLTQRTSMLFELNDYFVINGTYYDKNTMLPIPFEVLNLSNPANVSYMNLNTNVHLLNANDTNHYRLPRIEDNCVLKDDLDPNITYTIRSCSKGASNNHIFKIDETARKYMTGATHYSDAKEAVGTFIYQDVNYIYVLQHYSKTINIAPVIKVYQKSNLGTYKTITVGADVLSCITILKEFNGELFFTDSYGKDLFIIKALNLSTFTIRNVFTDSPSNSAASTFRTSPSEMTSGNEFFVARDGYVENNNVNTMIIKKYLFNEAENKFYTSTLNIDYGFNKKMTTSSSDSNYECHSFLKEGRRFIVVSNPFAQKKMYVFVQESGDNYKFVQEIILDSAIEGVLIPYNKYNTFIYATKTYITYYNFYSFESRYEKSNVIRRDNALVSIDKNGNIYVQSSHASQIDKVSVSIPAYFKSDFEQEEYNYVGEEIQTNINVYACTFEDKLVETEVTIALSGNVVFADDKSKRKTIKTSKSNVLKVPVIITEAGNIEAKIINK